MAKLTVVISTYNSENKIDECLKSVSFADEIIVVDGTSTDKTIDIAKKYTSKIFVRSNNPMLNINKNFGFTKATSEWILCLDSDERVTPELKEEIKKTLNEDNKEVNGYWIPRKNIIFGKWIEHTGWYPDYQLRLIRNGKGKFEEKHVHEMIKIEGKNNYLRSNLLHYNYDNISQFLKKISDIYAPNEAEQLIKNGYKFNWQDALRFPFKEFLNRYFLREGYKDGFHGLVLSLLMSFYHLVVFVSIWEKMGFNNINNENLIDEVEKEFKRSSKELSYWFIQEKIKKTKNTSKKIIYKIWRKFQ